MAAVLADGSTVGGPADRPAVRGELESMAHALHRVVDARVNFPISLILVDRLQR
jgi:hypothetical protein